MNAVIVIPTYNEADNIGALLDRLLGQDVAPHELHALVVDDSSPDGTAAAAESAGRRWPGRVEVLRRPGKAGLTAAYVAGFRHVLNGDAEFVGQMDADGSHDPAVVPAMLDAIAGADLVIGSRYASADSRDSRGGYYRRVISRLANGVVMRAILRAPITDPTGGFKLWRRVALQRIDPALRLRARDYGLQAELALLAAASGCRIAEVPIRFGKRQSGHSKMTAAVQLRTVVEIATLPWVQREAVATLRAQARLRDEAQLLARAAARADAPRRKTALP